MDLVQEIFNSPIGNIVTIFDKNGLCILDYEEYWVRIKKNLNKRYSNYNISNSSSNGNVRKKLENYFSGDLNALKDVKLSISGSDFQKKVWQELTLIRPGTTKNYSDIALSVNNKNAVRAIGLTNSLNPIAIIVPCHRVIGKNGKLSGYAGGQERKKWLLKHEKAI